MDPLKKILLLKERIVRVQDLLKDHSSLQEDLKHVRDRNIQLESNNSELKKYLRSCLKKYCAVQKTKIALEEKLSTMEEVISKQNLTIDEYRLYLERKDALIMVYEKERKVFKSNDIQTLERDKLYLIRTCWKLFKGCKKGAVMPKTTMELATSFFRRFSNELVKEDLQDLRNVWNKKENLRITAELVEEAEEVQPPASVESGFQEGDCQDSDPCLTPEGGSSPTTEGGSGDMAALHLEEATSDAPKSVQIQNTTEVLFLTNADLEGSSSDHLQAAENPVVKIPGNVSLFSPVKKSPPRSPVIQYSISPKSNASELCVVTQDKPTLLEESAPEHNITASADHTHCPEITDEEIAKILLEVTVPQLIMPPPNVKGSKLMNDRARRAASTAQSPDRKKKPGQEDRRVKHAKNCPQTASRLEKLEALFGPDNEEDQGRKLEALFGPEKQEDRSVEHAKDCPPTSPRLEKLEALFGPDNQEERSVEHAEGCPPPSPRLEKLEALLGPHNQEDRSVEHAKDCPPTSPRLEKLEDVHGPENQEERSVEHAEGCPPTSPRLEKLEALLGPHNQEDRSVEYAKDCPPTSPRLEKLEDVLGPHNQEDQGRKHAKDCPPTSPRLEKLEALFGPEKQEDRSVEHAKDCPPTSPRLEKLEALLGPHNQEDRSGKPAESCPPTDARKEPLETSEYLSNYFNMWKPVVVNPEAMRYVHSEKSCKEDVKLRAIVKPMPQIRASAPIEDIKPIEEPPTIKRSPKSKHDPLSSVLHKEYGLPAKCVSQLSSVLRKVLKACGKPHNTRKSRLIQRKKQCWSVTDWSESNDLSSAGSDVSIGSELSYESILSTDKEAVTRRVCAVDEEVDTFPLPSEAFENTRKFLKKDEGKSSGSEIKLKGNERLLKGGSAIEVSPAQRETDESLSEVLGKSCPGDVKDLCSDAKPRSPANTARSLSTPGKVYEATITETHNAKPGGTSKRSIAERMTLRSAGKKIQKIASPDRSMSSQPLRRSPRNLNNAFKQQSALESDVKESIGKFDQRVSPDVMTENIVAKAETLPADASKRKRYGCDQSAGPRKKLAGRNEMSTKCVEEPRATETAVSRKVDQPVVDNGGGLIDSIMSAMTQQTTEFRSNVQIPMPAKRKKGKKKKKSKSKHYVDLDKSPENESNPKVQVSNVELTKAATPPAAAAPPAVRAVRCGPSALTSSKEARTAIKTYLKSSNATTEEATSSIKACLGVLQAVPIEIISSVIVALVLENVDEELDLRFTPPAPPLSPTQHRLMALLALMTGAATVFDPLPGLLVKDLRAKLLPETWFWPDDSVESCARALAAIARMRGDPQSVWRLCIDSLWQLRQRSCLVVLTVLQTWPDLLSAASRNAAMPATLAHIVLQTPKPPQQRQERKLSALKFLLRNFYQFPEAEPSERQAKTLIDDFENSGRGDDALVLLCRWKGWAWVQKHVMPRLVTGLVAGVQVRSDELTAKTLSLIGEVAATFPPAEDLASGYVSQWVVPPLSELLYSGKLRQSVEENIVRVILRLAIYVNVEEVLRKWCPREAVNEELHHRIIEAMNNKAHRRRALLKKHSPRDFVNKVEPKNKRKKFKKKLKRKNQKKKDCPH